ncbi:MAG: TIGR04066 family peptide maturation system protein [Lachnospiraceae bacterium]|nr:TIGR04066 family peptide maturation system protein [Lachnospiraceae bacterium]
MNVAIFPFGKEFEIVLKYSELLQEINVTHLLAPNGFGLSEKVVTVREKKYIVYDRIKEKEKNDFQALMIVESFQKISFGIICQQIEIFGMWKKKILIARHFTNEENNIILDICRKYDVELIDTTAEFNVMQTIYSPFMEIREIHTPIVAIAGNGENCSKFELQLEIRKRLLEDGYAVSSIGSRRNCELLGMHSFPQFMLEKILSEEEKIICYNNYIKLIEKTEQPEVIVIGIPGGLMPVTKKKHIHFGISAYEIFNAVVPDFTILTLHKDAYNEEYFDEISNFFKYRFNIKPDCYILSNYAIDRFSIGSVMPIKYIEHDSLEIEKQEKRYVHKVYNQNSYDDMYRYMIETLSSYEETKIL